MCVIADKDSDDESDGKHQPSLDKFVCNPISVKAISGKSKRKRTQSTEEESATGQKKPIPSLTLIINKAKQQKKHTHNQTKQIKFSGGNPRVYLSHPQVNWCSHCCVDIITYLGKIQYYGNPTSLQPPLIGM
jgi:hypothetical protein